MTITSTKNELVKFMRSLKQRSARRESGLHLIEGERLVFDVLEKGINPEIVIVDEKKTDFIKRLDDFGCKYLLATSNVIEAISDTTTPQGIVAEIKTPMRSMPSDWDDGMYIALDALQEPGNLGTVIRTADAMGASGIILGKGCTDPFSPKTLRSAMGSSYRVPIYEAELETCVSAMQRQGFLTICGHLKGEVSVPQIDGRKRVLIVIGNEANGVSDAVADNCKKICLPMFGNAESLNAAVAASIMMFTVAMQLHKQ